MNTKVKNSILKYLSVLLIFIFVLESLDLSVVFAGEQIGESWVHNMDNANTADADLSEKTFQCLLQENKLHFFVFNIVLILSI